MSSPEPRRGVRLGGREAAVRRLESTAVGSRALQRLAELAARLLDAESAEISLLGGVETVVGGAGLPPGAVGGQRPLVESLCAVTAATEPEPLVVPDARRDLRVAHLPAVADGTVGSCLGMPLAGFDGGLVGALCVFGAQPRDWTEGDVALLRQLADSVATELELSALSRDFEASRLRFELAIDAAGIGSFDYDLVTGRLTWDDRLIELFGYDRESFDHTLEACNARVHPEDLPRVSEAIQSAIDTCGGLEVEYRILLPGGRMRWVVARGRAMADDRGTAVRLLGAAYDNTQGREGEIRLTRVLESMSAAFFSLDRDWRFTYVNAEAERLLLRPREELLGGSIWELFPAAVGSTFEQEYRGAVEANEHRVFEAYYPPPLDAWYEVRAWPGPDGLSVYFLDVTERRATEERARRSAARLRLVAEVSALASAALGSGPRESASVQPIAEAIVPALGDWAVVTLMEEDGRVLDVGSWHADPAVRPLLDRYVTVRLAAYEPTAPLLRALSAGEVVAVDEIDQTIIDTLPEGEVRDLFLQLAPRSAVLLPLAARGRILGGITVYRGAEREPMDDDDLATARDVAERTALALDNSRLYEQQRRLAEGLQRSMLTAPPEPDHAEIAVRYQPALELAQVGGDWYDAFLQPGGATVLVIGDVVGHDTEAAAAMGQLRGLLRGIAYRAGVGPAEVLGQLDLAIQGLEMNTMATAVVARVEQTAEERAAGVTRLRWSNAGHPPPLVRHVDGRIEALSGERTELMLGVDAGARRSELQTTLTRPVTVLLYTDGLVEGRDLPLDEGIARLGAAFAELADLPLERLCDQLIERLRPGGLQDDVALVAIRLHPQDRPRPREAGPVHLPPNIEPEEPTASA